MVASHQSQLPRTREAHRNKLADNLASCRQGRSAPVWDLIKWPEKVALVLVNGEQYTGDWKNKIQENVQGPEYEAYLKDKFHWEDYHLSVTDWEVHTLLKGRKSPADRANF